MKTTMNIIYPLIALACFALSPQAQATCQDACLTNNNTVQDDDALISLTTGTDNTAIGFHALNPNTAGYNNTATGSQALFSNTTGIDNTATGAFALFNNTGYSNTATGAFALYSNTEGLQNTADSLFALYSNTTGNSNTADGFQALFSNTTGNSNTATGAAALVFNATGNDNTAIGFQALFHNTTGGSNIALGFQAGARLTTGSDNIYIGNTGKTGESNNIRIGTTGPQTATYIAAISGATVPTGIPVIVDTTGHLGTTTSSARFKDAIKPMDKASEAILALKPVTFRYKYDLDPGGVPQFGLVAEQVEKVNPDLVARDEQGKPYTVRYEAVNAMLLNEFLKEHRTVQEQGATIARLKKQVETLTESLQKISAQVQRSRPQMQSIANNQ